MDSKKNKKRKLYEEDNGFAQWGGYMAAKKSKLSRQFRSKAEESVSGTNSQLFKGVSIFVNGYTVPTADELKKLMMEYGGEYHHYYRNSTTTHIVATMLPHTKIKNLKNEKVVRPNWITDSIEVGKLLPYSNYLLYTPGLIQGQSKLGFSNSEQSESVRTSTFSRDNILPNLLEEDHSGEAFKTSSSLLDKNEILATSRLLSDDAHQMQAVRTFDFQNSKPSSQNVYKNQANIESPINRESEFGSLLLQLDDSSSSSSICLLTNNEKEFLENCKSEKFEDSFSLSSIPFVTSNDKESLINDNDKCVTGENVPSEVIELENSSNSFNNYINTEGKLTKEADETSLQHLSDDNGLTNKETKKTAAKAGDANFLSEYYSHSRLHHISTAGTDFKSYVRQLQTKHQGSFLGREKLMKDVQNITFDSSGGSKWNHKVFMHIDMDCFFVSVGLLKRPDLIGKPVAVAHSRGKNVSDRPGVDAQFEINYYQNRFGKKGASPSKKNPTETDDGSLDDHKFQTAESLGSTSEISSCSYEARKCGVTSGMFLGEAFKRCPDLQTIPYDFEEYTRISKILYETMANYTLQIEAISCDELFMDCTDIIEACGASPLTLARHLRTEIHLKTGCTASAGMGSNLLIARLATRTAKPNGEHYIPPEDNGSFMRSQRVEDLPGVGYSTSFRLRNLDVRDCAQLQLLTLEKLQKEFGPKTGKTLYEQCRGIDHRIVVSEKERKSVSAEVNYGMRFQQIEDAEGFLKEIAGEVEKRLKNAEKFGSQLTLKIKVRSKNAPMETAKFLGHGVCDNVARSVQLATPTDSSAIIAKECCSALRTMKVAASDIRGMGIQISRLSAAKPQQNVKTLEHFLQNQPKKNDPKVAVNVNNEDNFSLAIPSTSRSTAVNREWFPSPSQIDPTVWSALPKDIQSQLASEYKSFGSNLPVNPEKPSATSDVRVHELPHYSQLDVSVFDALPEDIRHEVLEAYTTKKQDSSTCFSNVKPKKSPVKSPVRRRGRKRKGLNTSPTKKAQNLGRKIFSPEKSEIVEESIPKHEPFRAALCGAVELPEVRLLIREWISSCEEPLEADRNVFINYIYQVILEKNLEKLDLIIKGFYRYVCESKNDDWKVVYLEVVENLQPRVEKLYGFPLKVPMF